MTFNSIYGNGIFMSFLHFVYIGHEFITRLRELPREWKIAFVYVLHTAMKFEMEYFLRRANVGKKGWRSIQEKTAMEGAGKTTIFPGDASLRVSSENACTTTNLNIVDLNLSLQNNPKEHWEVKIIHIQAVAAEGT